MRSSARSVKSIKIRNTVMTRCLLICQIASQPFATTVKIGRHITKAMDARKLYREDVENKWPDDVSARSVDLQKVIMLPRMPRVKAPVFTKRIIGFHETFASLGTSKKSKKSKLRNISVLWHEGVAGRKMQEICTAFVKAIKHERDKRHIIYWLDNCAGQNKNWCIFTAMTALKKDLSTQLK